MSKSIHALMLVIVFALASIVPWADAQQKPSNVLIWCQNTNGTSSPCVAGNSLDYDSGGGTVNQGTVGIALPASGGPVAGGTSTNPIRVDPTGTTTQPVSGTVTANAGTNLNTSSLLTTTAHDAAFGTAGTADSQVRTIQGIASMTPVQVSQSGTWNIGAVTTLPALPSNQSVNVAQMNGVATSMGNGASGTGTQRVTIANDSTGTMTVTQGTGTNLHVVCDSGCSSSAGFADNAAFTFGTTPINPIGGVLDDTGTNAATENSAAVARITAQKALHMNLRNGSGTEIGTSGAPLRVDPTGSTTQPVSGTVSITANSAVNVAQINGVTPLMGAGNTGTGSQRVTEATDSQLSAGVGATGDAAATAGSTGSVTAKLRLMTSQLDTISTAIAAIQTATQLIDDDQTGASGYSYLSVGTTEDEHAVKASAGRLFSITATNTNAAVRYLKCENDTAANTAPGTDTPELRIAIPGATTGAGFTAHFGPAGFAFSNGLTCWLVTGAADSDVAEVAANEIMVFYTYK